MSELESEEENVAPLIICDVCDKTFSTKSSLTRHKSCAAGGEKINCKMCEKTLCKSRLNEHLRAHVVRTQGLKIPCAECGTKFSTVGQLRSHLEKDHSVKQEKEHLFF